MTIEDELKDLLQKQKNAEDFRTALLKYLRSVRPLTPIVIDKVFPEAHRPKTKNHLIKVVTDFQHDGALKPLRDISFNSDASKFQILDLTINDSVRHIKSQYPRI